MEATRILHTTDSVPTVTISSRSWSPSLWLYLILLLITLIALWVFTFRNMSKTFPYTPVGFPNYLFRLLANTFIIVLLVLVAILATHEKSELLPLFLILLVLTVACIIVVEIALNNGTILGQAALFSTLAFLISLSFWSCILPSKVEITGTYNYTYTTILELPVWQIWTIYLSLFLVNVWLLYLTYETTTLWVKTGHCPQPENLTPPGPSPPFQ